MIKRNHLILILIMAASIIAPSLHSQDQNNFEISKNIEIYIDVLRKLNLDYADDINPGDLNKTAIDALLGKLDPYTVYVPESKLEDFELMTKGEYGGIGALIQKQDDYVVITEPYEGFPAQKAGLIAGDKIIKVDGEEAMGKSTSAVSEKLKGVPGTKLVITIQRYGDSSYQDIELIREKVKIPNIPYYGMVENGIGYISLNQFNANAGAEVKKAFNELKSANKLQGIVIDLRGNGGGLLSEAVNITNLFVPKGTTVVTTKGKLAESSQTHRTRAGATNTKIPLVVLVNSNSASASEIVAGAIQDLDRGVIIGERTFGKGLVQHVLPLPYNSKLKITIAKYYIPSGRCIQAIDYFNENHNGRPDKIPDSLISEFKTSGGRIVFDGGGIEPDIDIDSRQFSQITGDLFSQNYIFNFANDFVLKNDSIPGPASFKIDDKIYNDFKTYVEDRDFSYSTETEALIENLRSSADREGYIEAIAPVIDSLTASLRREKLHDIDKHCKEIKELLKFEIVARYYYQKGKVIAALENDPDLKEAIRVLTDEVLYQSILNGTYVKNDKIETE